jgi:hypothetical protein
LQAQKRSGHRHRSPVAAAVGARLPASGDGEAEAARTHLVDEAIPVDKANRLAVVQACPNAPAGDGALSSEGPRRQAASNASLLVVLEELGSRTPDDANLVL